VTRPSTTEERRRQIVDALILEMAEHGYEHASIQAIARRAGLSPGLIHYHFANKQEILLEVIRKLRGVIHSRFQMLSRGAVTPRERVRAFIDTRLGRGEGAGPAVVAAWVIVGAEAVRQPEVKATYQEAVRTQQTLLESLIREYAGDALTPREAQNLCGIVLAAIEGAFLFSVTAQELMPKGYAARTLMALIDDHVARGPAHEHLLDELPASRSGP